MSKATKCRPEVPVGNNVDPEVIRFRAQFDESSPLDEIVRRGAKEMLQTAIEREVENFLIAHAGRTDHEGRRLVVRNGHLPSRKILTGAGSLEVQQPRVRDNSPDPETRVRFSSSLLPP